MKIKIVKNKEDTILVRRFISELVIIGLVFGLLRTSMSQISDGFAIHDYFSSFDGKLFGMLCIFTAVTFFWNPVSYVCELKMISPGRTVVTRFFKSVVRNLPRSILLLLGLVNAIWVMSDPGKFDQVDEFWIEGGELELAVNVLFVIYTVDKLAVLRDWEHTLLDSILKVRFERR